MEHHASKDLVNSKYSASALGGTDGKVVALAAGRHIFFHAVGEGTGKQIESVGAAHGSSGSAIISMEVRREGGGGYCCEQGAFFGASGFFQLFGVLLLQCHT